MGLFLPNKETIVPLQKALSRKLLKFLCQQTECKSTKKKVALLSVVPGETLRIATVVIVITLGGVALS